VTNFHKLNYRCSKVYEITGVPCPEGFSPGTPVSLTPENQLPNIITVNKIGDTLLLAN